MAIFDTLVVPAAAAAWPSRARVVVDANAPAATIAALASRGNLDVWLEPVSVPKAVRACGAWASLGLVKPNLDELRAIAEGLKVAVPEKLSLASVAPVLEKLVHKGPPAVSQSVTFESGVARYRLYHRRSLQDLFSSICQALH